MSYPAAVGVLAQAHIERLRSEAHEPRGHTDPPPAAGAPTRRPWAADNPASGAPAGYSAWDDPAARGLQSLTPLAMELSALAGATPGPALAFQLIRLLFRLAPNLWQLIRDRQSPR